MARHVFIFSIPSEACHTGQYNSRVYALQNIGSKPKLLKDARPEGINDYIGIGDKFLDESLPRGRFNIYGDRGLMARQKIGRWLRQFRRLSVCFVRNSAINTQNRGTAVSKEKSCKWPCTTSAQVPDMYD